MSTAGRDRSARLRVPRRVLLTLVTAHIALSVALLGDSAGFLAVAIRRALTDDEASREPLRSVLGMFALFFGIPLSFLALLTGLALGLTTRWGVFRHAWVVVKLALVLSVIAVGATAIKPALQPGDPSDASLIIGSLWDVLALVTAVVLAVFKPRRRREPAERQVPTVPPHNPVPLHPEEMPWTST